LPYRKKERSDRWGKCGLVPRVRQNRLQEAGMVISADIKASRFFVNIVTAQTGASNRPLNQRKVI